MEEHRIRDGSPSDDVLVERIKRKDLQSFEELVNRYKKKSFYIAFSLIGDREAAEDISQEAFIRVYKKIEGFRGESSFQSWFYRIILNLCRSHLRHRYLVNRFTYWFRKSEEDELDRSLETTVPDTSSERKD